MAIVRPGKKADFSIHMRRDEEQGGQTLVTECESAKLGVVGELLDTNRLSRLNDDDDLLA